MKLPATGAATPHVHSLQWILLWNSSCWQSPSYIIGVLILQASQPMISWSFPAFTISPVPATSEFSSWQPQGSVTFTLLSSFQRHLSSITGKSEVQWSIRKGKCLPVCPKDGLPWRWHLLGEEACLSTFLLGTRALVTCSSWLTIGQDAIRRDWNKYRWLENYLPINHFCWWQQHVNCTPSCSWRNRSGFDLCQVNRAMKAQMRGLALLLLATFLQWWHGILYLDTPQWFLSSYSFPKFTPRTEKTGFHQTHREWVA